MKKIILLSGLLLLVLCVHSQAYYILEYDIVFKIGAGSNLRYYNSASYTTTSGHSGRIEDLRIYRGSHDEITKINSVRIPVSEGIINYLKFETSRQYKEGWPIGWDEKCSGWAFFRNDQYCFELTSLNLPCFTHTDIEVNKFSFHPDISISGEKKNGVSTGNMGDDDVLTLHATPGFNADIYKWEYATKVDTIKTQGKEFCVYNWKRLPAKFFNKDLATIKTNVLFTETELLQHYNQDIHFRIAYDCNDLGSNIVFFRLNKSAPHIIKKEITPNQCKGDSEAKIKLTFDRPKYPNESIGVEYGHMEIIQLAAGTPFDSDNSVVIPHLFEGLIHVQVFGAINGISDYSDGEFHKDSVLIVDPGMVEMTNTNQRNISCFEGNDGAFRVNASGGVKNYKLFIKQETVDNDFREIPFPSADANSIYMDNLRAGTYTFYTVDGNNCQCRDKNNYAAVNEITLTQPATPLATIDRNQKNPTGYGLTNGYASIKVNGGTLKDDKSYNVVWKDKNGNVLSSVYNEYNEIEQVYSSILSDMGDGEYTVEVTDKNYAGAYLNCNTTCVVRDTFTLVQPPPLVVSIEETHYVSCWGDSDGELTVYADGGVPFDGIYRYKYTWFRKDSGQTIELGTDSVQGNLTTGYYCVKVEDRNGNVTVSADKLLLQPDKLVINTTGSEILCNGNNTGHVNVTATGGTPPYSYEWNTGDTTSAVSGLPIGFYEIKVSDTRKCYQKANAIVSSPDQLEISTLVAHPVCYGEKNGSIQVSVTGGHPPYQYSWNTGSKTPNIDNAGAGIYKLTVSDINGCVVSHADTLVQPKPLRIELGPDRTLCREQSLTLSPEAEDNSSAFLWLRNGKFFSSSKQVTITDEGVYTVEQTDSRSCTARDTITIRVEDVEISSEFIVASNVFRNDTILFVNISDPFPEQAEWIIADNPKVKVVDVNEHYVRAIFSENGMYNIGFRSRVGKCFREIYKDIVVIEPEDFFSTDEYQQDLILHFSVQPNPNSGIFSATIELEKKASIRLRLVNLSTGATLSDIRLHGEQDYAVPYNLQLSSGAYGLVLETAAGRAIVKIIAF